MITVKEIEKLAEEFLNEAVGKPDNMNNFFWDTNSRATLKNGFITGYKAALQSKDVPDMQEIGKLNFYGWTKDGMKENPKNVPPEDVFVLRSAVLAALQNNKISECYFIPEKKGTSVTICTNCGKEKMLHTIGEGIKVSKVIYQSEPTVSGISAEEVLEKYPHVTGTKEDDESRLTIKRGDLFKLMVEYASIVNKKEYNVGSESGISAEEILHKYIPDGIVNMKAIGKGNGKPQYKAEIEVIVKCMEEYAAIVNENLLQELGEKEVMIKAFADIQEMFERRSWIMEGRGNYPYNDDRYKEEVKYLYDDFTKLKKDVWKNIKTKTFEYREKMKDSAQVFCAICGKSITETGTVYKGKPVHIECYRKAKNERKDSEEMPDIEKLIEKFLPNQFDLASSKPEVVELLKSAFQQGATVIFNALQDKRKDSEGWVSVEGRLPEIGDEVIVYCPECKHKITALTRLIRYEGATGFFWDNHYGGSNVHVQDSVTHWMPLPEPPESQPKQ